MTKEPSLWNIRQYPIYATATGEIYGESGLGYHCEIDLWITGLSGGRRWDVDHISRKQRHVVRLVSVHQQLVQIQIGDCGAIAPQQNVTQRTLWRRPARREQCAYQRAH